MISVEMVIRLEIKQDSEGYHHVPGVVDAKVDNIKEVWNVLQAGSNARAVGSNNVNEHSSRSHWYPLAFFPSFIAIRRFFKLMSKTSMYFPLSILLNDCLFHFQHALYNGKGKKFDEW